MLGILCCVDSGAKYFFVKENKKFDVKAWIEEEYPDCFGEDHLNTLTNGIEKY